MSQMSKTPYFTHKRHGRYWRLSNVGSNPTPSANIHFDQFLQCFYEITPSVDMLD